MVNYEDDEIVEIEVEVLKQTSAAYLIEARGEEMWVQKSKVEIEDGIMQIPEWLATKKGLL